MLGIDLLIIVILSLIFTIWMISVDKPDSYFEDTKKYNLEEYYRTEEALNDEKKLRNSVNVSKARLNETYLNQSNIQIEELHEEEFKHEDDLRHSLPKNTYAANKSDNENEAPLPNIPIRASHINL